ncbi:MAG: DUF1579 domain-containing protein [Planctomycetaceae bacterium]
MRARPLLTLFLILAATLLGALRLNAGGEGGEARQPSPEEMAAMMKRWQESCTPGEPHQWLAQFVGTWDTTMKVTMGGPGTAAMESKGTAQTRWLVEGKWLSMESSSVMMKMPSKHFGTLGYDNFKRKFVQSYVDSMGTALYTSEGLRDRTGTVLTLYGAMDEPMTGEHDKPVKYVMRVLDNDRLVYEIHDLAIGEPNTMVVEITYTRKK